MSDGASVVDIAGGGSSAPGEIRRVAVIKGGGSLERSVSLRSGARAQSALKRLGHDVVAIDAGPQLAQELPRASRTRRSSPCTAATARTARCRSCSKRSAIPYTGSGPAACVRCTDKALAKHLMRAAGIPTPDFRCLQEASIKEFGAGAAPPAIEAALGFPLVVKPARGGSALGVKFAHSSAELPAAIVGALSYDDKALIERYVKGRDLAVSVLDAQDGRGSVPEPLALPVSRRSRARRTSTTTSPATRSA